MARRILALDIGSYAIKAALIESTLRRCQVTHLIQHVREPARSLEEQLEEFRTTHALQADTVLSCLPGDAVSVRFLDLPFTRARQLEQTVPFELSNQIPFDLDVVMVDFHVVRRTEQGTVALAVAVPTTTLTEHLTMLAAAGFDPVAVGLTTLAPLTLLPLAQADLSGVTALLDIGENRVSVVLLHQGVPQGLRTLSIGLSRAGGLLALLRALRWTLLAQGADTLTPIDRIFVCGGGSCISRLREELAQALSVEVIAFHELLVPSVPEPLQQEQGVYATCLGLGLHEALGSTIPTINLRRGALTHQGRREVTRKEAARLGWLAASVAAAAGITFALETHRLSTRYDSVRQEIRRVFTSTLPEVRTIVNEKAQLRDAVETLRSRQQLFQGSSSPSPLELLRQLSVALPDQVSLDLEEWTFDTDFIRLRGATSSFEAAEVIKTTAAGIGAFREVQLKDVKAVTGGKKVSFGLQLALKAQMANSTGNQE
jgi:hypothetical protein